MNKSGGQVSGHGIGRQQDNKDGQSSGGHFIEMVIYSNTVNGEHLGGALDEQTFFSCQCIHLYELVTYYSACYKYFWPTLLVIMD